MSRTCHFGLESLESRALLAGDITAVVSGGWLIITGDDAANCCTMHPGATAGEFILRDSDGCPTQINGSSSDVTLPGVTKGVKVDLRAGADEFGIDSCTIPGGVTVVGSDSNTCWIANSPVAGNVIVNFSAGGGTVDFSDDAEIDGSLTVTSGAAALDFSMDDSRVYGNVRITAGGVTECLLDSATVYGGLSITTADTNADIDLSAATISKNVAIAAGGGSIVVSLGSDIGGSLSMSATGGAADIYLSASTIDKNVKATSTAAMTFRSADTGIAGSVSVASSSGDTELRLETVTIYKNLKLTAGDGASHDFETWDDTDIFGSVSLSRGDGASTLMLYDSRLRKNLSISDGVGSHSVTLLLADVLGSVKCTGGDGATATLISGSSVASSTSIRWGNGNDSLNFSSSTVDALSVSAGAGTSFLTFNASNVTGKVRSTNGDAEQRFWTNPGSTFGSSIQLSTVQKLDVKFSNTTIAGAVSATGGYLLDSFASFGGTVFGGKVSVDLGAAGNDFIVDDTTFNGAVSIETGDGNDTIHFDLYSGDGVTTINGKLSISSGGGVDLIYFGVAGEANHKVVFASSVSIDAGAGNDTVRFFESVDTYASEPTIKNAEIVL